MRPPKVALKVSMPLFAGFFSCIFPFSDYIAISNHGGSVFWVMQEVGLSPGWNDSK
jgi:hypothetical protein